MTSNSSQVQTPKKKSKVRPGSSSDRPPAHPKRESQVKATSDGKKENKENEKDKKPTKEPEEKDNPMKDAKGKTTGKDKKENEKELPAKDAKAKDTKDDQKDKKLAEKEK